METATLIIGILTLVSTALSPIILASAYFIQNIQHSKCCGGSEIEMRQNPIPTKDHIPQERIKQIDPVDIKPRKKSDVDDLLDELVKRRSME